MSKIWVAALLALYQAAVYTIVHYLAFDMPGGALEFFQVYITMTLVTLAGMMLGLFASALAPNASSAPLLVIMLMLPQIVLGGALVAVPNFVSAPTSTRWAFEALISITGPGSDVAADLCWKLPPDVRNAMSLEQKLASNCRCMGINILKQESCNHPGLGAFQVTAANGPVPVEPQRPPDPVIPERPVQPQDQSDSIAMAEYFAKLQLWEAEATSIQEESQRQFAEYERALSEYLTESTEVGTAVFGAESVVRTFYNGAGMFYVNKEDPVAYVAKVGFAWSVQSSICLLLFAAILYLQKRKDVI
jgi:hypothetical protein